MGTVNVTLGEDTRLNLILGQQLENAVTSVVFDFSAWQTTYGSGTLALSVQRPGDEMPYAVTLTTSGTNATWSVTNLDTAYKGVGHIQLTYTVGTAIKKSVVYKFTVYESLGANGEYPSPGQTWQEGIEDDIEGLRTDVDADHDELIDIREGADGVTYPSAGDAVRGQITDVKSDLTQLSDNVEKYTGNETIELTNGYYIKTNLSVGATVDLTPVVGYATNNYAVLDAQEGDKFTLNATGGNASRLWCFVDSNNKLLSVASAGVTVSDYVLTAPANTSKIIINPITGYGLICKGEYLVERVNDLESSINTVNTVLSANIATEQTARENADGEIKKSLNAILTEDVEIPIYIVDETDIVAGGFSSGVETVTPNRARNTRFIHVYPGDVAVVNPVESGLYRTYAILTYDLSYTFVSQGSWTGLAQTTFTEFTSECYIRVIFNAGNASHTSEEYKSYFKNAFTLIRSAGNKKANVALLNRYSSNHFERIIEEADIRKGTLDISGVLQPHDNRCVTPSYIPVMEGDYLERMINDVAISAHYYDSSFSHVSGPEEFEYYSFPTIVPSGVSYVRIAFNNANVTTPTPSDFNGAVKITHFAGRTEMLSLGVLNRVEHSTSKDFVRGYVDSTGVIQSHDHYAATRKMFRVKRGDIVRITKNDMYMAVREYDASGRVVRAGSYIGRVNRNPYSAGEWRVSTDGFIRATIINYNSSTDVDFITNGDMLEIVHVVSPLSERDALGDSWVTPRNYIRPRIIRENQDLHSQSGVMIDGFLYQATDDYNGHYTIQKVDVESGTTVKTYTHNIGHCASLDYCPETDTLITWDGKIILYPNFKTALQGSTLSLSDCIVIDTDLPTDSSWCFGEDGYTLYGFHGYDSTTEEIANVAYKVELGFGTNDLSSDGYGTYSAGDSYNGTAKLLSTFNGEIREDHDGIFKTNGLPYSQDIKYDGYLYLGYGTKGYNCFVLDLDENSLTYRVKGNYTWIYRTSAYVDKYGEPQVVALNGSKIVSVLRDIPTNISCMIEFNRS